MRLARVRRSREYMKNNAPAQGIGEDEALVTVAEHLGYEITKEDLARAVAQREEEIRTVRKAAENTVQELSFDDLDNVAGGGSDYTEKKHDKCKDTYLQSDNCGWEDRCDYAFNMYSDSLCNTVQVVSDPAFYLGSNCKTSTWW